MLNFPIVIPKTPLYRTDRTKKPNSLCIQMGTPGRKDYWEREIRRPLNPPDSQTAGNGHNDGSNRTCISVVPLGSYNVCYCLCMVFRSMGLSVYHGDRLYSFNKNFYRHLNYQGKSVEFYSIIKSALCSFVWLARVRRVRTLLACNMVVASQRAILEFKHI